MDVLKGIWQRDLEEPVDPIARALLEQHVGVESELACGLFLSAGQIREMRSAGMTFGGHSRTHPWFDFVDQPRRTQEIRASKQWLEQIEEPPFAFAYPYGGLAADTPGLLSANGFATGFTTRTQQEHSDPYYIGRLDGEELHA